MAILNSGPGWSLMGVAIDSDRRFLEGRPTDGHRTGGMRKGRQACDREGQRPKLPQRKGGVLQLFGGVSSYLAIPLLALIQLALCPHLVLHRKMRLNRSAASS